MSIIGEGGDYHFPWHEYHGEDTHGWSVLHDKYDREIGSGDGGFDYVDASAIVASVNACIGAPVAIKPGAAVAMRVAIEHLIDRVEQMQDTHNTIDGTLAVKEAQSAIAMFTGERNE